MKRDEIILWFEVFPPLTDPFFEHHQCSVDKRTTAAGVRRDFRVHPNSVRFAIDSHMRSEIVRCRPRVAFYVCCALSILYPTPSNNHFRNACSGYQSLHYGPSRSIRDNDLETLALRVVVSIKACSAVVANCSKSILDR